MRTLKVHLKGVALFFSVLILFQGCTVYKSASVTLDEASKSNTHVRVKTFDNQSLKFSRIEVVNNKIHGIKIHNGFTSITPIEKDNIELGRLGKTLKNVPQFISMAQLTPEALAKAEEVAKAELKAEGKPEQIWDRILPGKMERFVSDNTTLDQEQCLLDQNFIKDEKKSVDDYIKSYGNTKVTAFVRVTLG